MKTIRNRALAIIFLVVLLLAWAPWISSSFAEMRAITHFNTSWQGIIDGCGTECRGCGVINSSKTFFGIFVTLEFACGMIPADTPEYHKISTGFVSFIGSVHGLPLP